MLFQCFFNAWRRHFDTQRLHLAPFFLGVFFWSRLRFFERINWKYVILTIASYASRSEDFGSLNIVQKRWEKVEFQAVPHILRWFSNFGLPAPFAYRYYCIWLWLLSSIFESYFRLKFHRCFRKRFGQNLLFSYSIISFDEGSGLSKEIGGRSTKNR